MQQKLQFTRTRPVIPSSVGVGGESSTGTKRPRSQETDDEVVDPHPPKKVAPLSPEQAGAEIQALTSQAERKARAVQLCREYPSLARYVLGRQKNVEKDGWCSRVILKGNKAEGSGYLQVSYWGANKFAVLHRVVRWAGGEDVGEGDHGSHLCPNTDCSTVGHIAPEDPSLNNGRKGCAGWVDCPCGVGKLLLCTHAPACVQYCPGFDSQEHFLREGVCHKRDGARGVVLA